MDFGDILNEWDKEKKKAKEARTVQKKGHKKANAPTKEEKEAMAQGYSYEEQMKKDFTKKANPMDVWLNRYGVVDKDKINAEAQKEAKLYNREYLHSLKPEAILDLHGLTRDEAWEKLKLFVDKCAQRSLRKILIIHGKGNHSHGSDPVLGATVRLFIEQDSRLGASGHPDKNHGGSGATWVFLKQK